MTNHRLRSAMAARSLTPASLSARVEVDPKSVERWVTQGRIPRAGTRARVAEALGYDETYFWPSLLGSERTVGTTSSELVQIWPARGSVPGDVWDALITQAETRIDVLVYAATFLTESHRLAEVLEDLSARGGTARILLGDSSSPVLVQRGIDEGLPNVPGRAASALEYLGAVKNLPGVQIRLHDTALYASLYRFEDTLMVNLHTHGLPAKDSPVLQLIKVPGGQLFDYYTRAFQRVWDAAKPA